MSTRRRLSVPAAVHSVSAVHCGRYHTRS